MFQSEAFDSFFIEAVIALKPYLSDLVAIGGGANVLYRYHKSASETPLPYLGTKDLDWAVPQNLPSAKRPLIADLLANAGFKEKKLGTSEQAIVKYLPRDENLAADIEFLCPQSGLPGERSKGSTARSYPVQQGFMAQPLRYLELLQHRSWEIELGGIPEFVALRGLRIRVPNPAAYVVQKVLIRDQRRGSPSAAKDCYYIYEVSVIFRDTLDAIVEESAALKEKFKPCLKKFLKMAGPLFAGPNAEGPTATLRVFNEMRAALGSNSADLTGDLIYRAVSKLLAAMR